MVGLVLRNHMYLYPVIIIFVRWPYHLNLLQHFDCVLCFHLYLTSAHYNLSFTFITCISHL